MLSTQAGDIPLIPEWTLSFTGMPGSAVSPAYIVTEDLIEYHRLSDPNPRIFQLGVPSSLARQYVIDKRVNCFSQMRPAMRSTITSAITR